MTWSWPFEKGQNGVRFGKCVPRFAQLWLWKCFSSANNAVIRTENCQLYIIFNWKVIWSVIFEVQEIVRESDENGLVQVRMREVILIWLCQQELNECTCIWRCQSVQLALHYAHAISLQTTTGNRIWTKGWKVGFGIPPSGPSYNIVVILYKYSNWCSDSSIA